MTKYFNYLFAVMHFTWSHFLVKLCYGQMPSLLEVQKLEVRPPCLFWVQVAALRFSGNPGVWSQPDISVSRLIPSRLCEYWSRRKDWLFSLLFPKNGKEVSELPESAASAREKEQLVLHWGIWRWRNSLRPVTGRQRRHQTDYQGDAASRENQWQHFSVLQYFGVEIKKSLHPHIPHYFGRKALLLLNCCLASAASHFFFLPLCRTRWCTKHCQYKSREDANHTATFSHRESETFWEAVLSVLKTARRANVKQPKYLPSPFSWLCQ